MELTSEQHYILSSRPIEVIVPWEEVVNILSNAFQLKEYEIINSTQAHESGLHVVIKRRGHAYNKNLSNSKYLVARPIEL